MVIDILTHHPKSFLTKKRNRANNLITTRAFLKSSSYFLEEKTKNFIYPLINGVVDNKNHKRKLNYSFIKKSLIHIISGNWWMISSPCPSHSQLVFIIIFSIKECRKPKYKCNKCCH